jgi:hypothetical protein
MPISKLTDEKKDLMQEFVTNISRIKDTPQEEKKLIKMYARLHCEHPDVYVIMRPDPARLTEGYKNEGAKKFLKFVRMVNFSI